MANKKLKVGNVPNLRFPGFEEEWEIKKLEEITSWSSGGTPPKDNPSFWNGDIPWISASSMRGLAYSDSELKITQSGLKEGSKLASKGTLLILVRGSMLFNKIPIGIASKNVAFNQDVKSITVNDYSTSEYILNWFLASEAKILNMVTGTGIGAGKLDLQELKELKIKIPSLSEQQKIALFLSLINERIDTQNKIIKQLETLIKGLSEKLFSQKIRFKEFKNEWELKSLEEICYFHKGSPLSKNDLVTDGNLKCIHYGELFTTYKAVISDIISYTNNDGFRSKMGDILMPSSDVTPLGLATASTILEGNVVLGSDINVLRPNVNINSIFLSYLLNSQKKKIIELVSGTTVKHIYNKDLKQIKVYFPFFKEQIKIAQFLVSIDNKIQTEKELLDKYHSQKKHLLQNLFI